MAAEINLSEVRQLLNKILDHIEEENGCGIVKMHHDNYWDVSAKNRYDFKKSPSEFVVGQLYDDWYFLSHLLKDDSQFSTLMMMHLVPILRYIGESGIK